MLQLKIYSEREVDKDGIITKIGEDAHPFINDAGMFVADGMGGGAGVKVINIKPECFESNKLANLFSKEFDFTLNDKMSNYIAENFSSLTTRTMKNIYTNASGSIIRLKKSGYFGSHALGTVLAMNLIKIEDKIENLSDDEWKHEINIICKNIYNEYLKFIEMMGAECAKINISKIDYFGTTLSGVFFNEKEDYVDAIFVNSGDSRSYVWDLKGFRQACDDQGRNGGMITRISANSELDEMISITYKQFKKPCSIICMTDGFYTVFVGENGFSATPLRMEGFLMDSLSKHSSLQDEEEYLKGIFDKNGNIDDSNSMVMASFGFDSYEDLRKAADKRLNYIREAYHLDDRPNGFLIEDYGRKVRALQEDCKDLLQPLLSEAYELLTIQQYCQEKIEQRKVSHKYYKSINTVNREIEHLHDEAKSLKYRIRNLIKNNFLDFEDLNEISIIKSFCKNSVSNIKKDGKEYVLDGHERENLFDTFFEQSNMFSKELKESRQGREKEIIINNYINNLHDILSSVTDISRNRTLKLQHWETGNKRLADKYEKRHGINSINKIVDSYLLEELSIDETTIPYVKTDLINLINLYKTNVSEVISKKAELKLETEKAAKLYWDENGYKDIHELLDIDNYFKENPELKENIINAINQNDELKKYQNLHKEQEEVFNHYLEFHLSETSEEKRLDVEKNGWI